MVEDATAVVEALCEVMYHITCSMSSFAIQKNGAVGNHAARAVLFLDVSFEGWRDSVAIRSRHGK